MRAKRRINYSGSAHPTEKHLALDQPNAAFPMRQEDLPQLRRQTVRCGQPRRLCVAKQGVMALAMFPPGIVNAGDGSGEASHQL